MSTGGGNSGLYRWDPEKSSREKFVALGLGTAAEYNFSALATKLLGQAQPNQFQSSDQTGYIWGSRYSDDGNWTLLSEVTNNENSEIPRGYAKWNDIRGYTYNWYAATAETGKYNMPGGTIVSDSICPKGWILPSGTPEDAAVSYGELFTAYEFVHNSVDSSKKARQLPIAIAYAGGYGWRDGTTDFEDQTQTFFHTSRSRAGVGRIKEVDLSFVNYGGANYDSNGNKTIGDVVRCALRNQ